MKLIFKILINALGLMLLPVLFGSSIFIDKFSTAIFVVIVLDIFNFIIKPILILLTLPVNIITLGLFRFVINGFIFWLVSLVIGGFKVEGIVTAILGALVMSCISIVSDKIVQKTFDTKGGAQSDDNFPKSGDKVRDI